MSTDSSPPASPRLSLRRLVREASYLSTGTAGTMLLLLVQSVLVARSLGDSLLGVWGYMQALVALPRGVLGFRTPEALGRFLVEHDDADDELRLLILSTSFYLELAVSLATFLVAVGVAPYIATQIAREPALLPLFRVFSLTALTTWVQPLWTGVERQRRAFAHMAALPLLVTTAQVVILAVLWARDQLGLEALAWVGVGYAVALAALQWPAVRAVMSRRMSLATCWRRRREIRPFWAFMTTGYLENTVRSALGQADVLLLGRFTSNAVAGEYRLAKSLAGVAGALARSLATVSYQDFNDALRQGQRRHIRQYLVRLMRILLPVVACATAVAWWAAPVAIGAAYGPSFELAPDLFRIYSIGVAASVLLYWARQLLMVFHDLKYLLWNLLAMGSLTLLGMYLTARFGTPHQFVWAAMFNIIVGNTLVAVRAWRLTGERSTTPDKPA